MIWLATGGVNNLNTGRCKILKGRRVIMFPDLGAEEILERKCKDIQELHMAKVNTWLRERASPEDIEKGLDLGDWIVRHYI